MDILYTPKILIAHNRIYKNWFLDHKANLLDQQIAVVEVFNELIKECKKGEFDVLIYHNDFGPKNDYLELQQIFDSLPQTKILTSTKIRNIPSKYNKIFSFFIYNIEGDIFQASLSAELVVNKLIRKLKLMRLI